jgi:hypothetical protein
MQARNETMKIQSTNNLALRTSSATDIDADKVAAINAALGNGTYGSDSGSIADGMLGLARDLLQRRLHPASDMRRRLAQRALGSPNNKPSEH